MDHMRLLAAAEPPYPDTLGQPVAGWVFSVLMPIIWALIMIVIIIQTAQQKFSILSLLFIAGTTMFWIEWPADWGSYLVYNRNFPLFSGWTSTWYQTYWKPIPLVFGYGIFFGLAAVILTYGVPAIRRRLPKLPPVLVTLIASEVIFYAFDITAEKTMTLLGWYSYAEPVGPAWHGQRGNISFVWPAIPFLGFATCLSLLTYKQDSEGFFPNERWFGVPKVTEGVRREGLRLLTWIATLNVLLFVFQGLANPLGRILFLHDSVYNP
jgi:hypothetical protein